MPSHSFEDQREAQGIVSDTFLEFQRSVSNFNPSVLRARDRLKAGEFTDSRGARQTLTVD